MVGGKGKQKEKEGIKKEEECDDEEDEDVFGDEDMKKLVMDFFAVQGYSEAAKIFAEESSTPLPEEFPLLEQRSTIIEAINNGDASRAGEQLNEMNPEVMEEEEELAFRLRLLHLVGLTQQDDIDEVLRFAHEELAFRVQDKPNFLKELEQVMMLLAFPNEDSPVNFLKDVGYRQKIAAMVNQTILEREGSPSESHLSKAMELLETLQESSKKRKNKSSNSSNLFL
mmetsp:Transcript_29951/g.46384  ORF Transcript_29951/g.46384 Transcript_29951/m.46384 type:complete len:226 (-) Transcript_29951:889-1566(-)